MITIKRIWFVQQKPFDYRPLRVGLGLISIKELNARGVAGLCPKIYTTRTRRLSGEYYVVDGSRFKAKPVEPRIEFRVTNTCRLNLAEGLVCPIHNGKPDYENWATVEILNKNDLTFAELDLGIKGVTYGQLRDELLRLNPEATIDTPFYVNLLETM